MTDFTPTRPPATAMQWVARGLMAILWAAGSAYLIAHGLAEPQPSWIEIVTIPALWAAVIAAPIIAHNAVGNRDHVAAALLIAASLIGSAWTLSGTIARQSEGADERMARGTEVERQRRDLTQRLTEAQEILARHRKAQAVECASGVGKRCDGVTYTVQTWTAAVEGYEAKLKALPVPRSPEAGAKRMAALLALLPGVHRSARQLEPEVQLVAPALFGVFIELAALAFGFFGFRPVRTTAGRPAAHAIPAPIVTTAPVMVPVPATAPVIEAMPKAEPAAIPENPVEDEAEPEAARRKLTKGQAEARVMVLRRPASQDALARRWGVTRAAISQWVADWEARGVVTRVRHGRCKLVAPAPRRLRVVRAA